MTCRRVEDHWRVEVSVALLNDVDLDVDRVANEREVVGLHLANRHVLEPAVGRVEGEHWRRAP